MSHRKVTYLSEHEDRQSCYEKSVKISHELKRADIPPISSSRHHRYYDIDSTFRNRTIYPNPANFVINTSNLPKGSVAPGQAEDPISLAIPLVTGQLPPQTPIVLPPVPPSTTSITFPATSPTVIQMPNAYTGGSPFPFIYYNIYNYYAGWYLGLSTIANPVPEYRQIQSYSSNYQQVTLTNPFTIVDPNTTPYFTLSKQLPLFTGIVGTTTYVAPTPTTAAIPASPTTTTIQLDPNIGGNPASNVNNAYVGSYLYITPPPNVINSGNIMGYYSLITQYDGINHIATLSSPLIITPAVGSEVLISQYTRDNSGTLIHNTVFGNNPMCHNVSLIYLSIPNVPLSNTLANGGNISSYPYVYVRFENEFNSSTSDGLISSNNSKAYYSQFKIPVPGFNPSDTFVHFRDSRMSQTIKFRGDQPIRFSVMLPNGDPLQFIVPDTSSPYEPNPFLQVSATFQIDKTE
jgi:hypothetical protein